MACIPPNSRRVGYIDPIHGPLDGPLYMGSIYSNSLSYVIGFFFDIQCSDYLTSKYRSEREFGARMETTWLHLIHKNCIMQCSTKYQ